jgi:hypothetical protein
MDHKNIVSCHLTAFAGDESRNAFAMIVEAAEGETFTLSMPRTVALQVAEQLTAALLQLARDSAPLKMPTALTRAARKAN